MKTPNRWLFSIVVATSAVIGASVADAAVDSIDLDALFGGTGSVLKSDLPNDEFGMAVSIIGDINADGFDDMLVGASAAQVVGVEGEAYVLFGHDGGFASTIDVASLNGSNGFTIFSSQAEDQLGRAATGIGDINGDGIDDFAVSAPTADVHVDAQNTLYHGGKVYVVFGHVGTFAPSLDLGNLDGNNGFRIDSAQADAWVGYSINAAGDFNGDGLDDLLVGSNGTSMVDDAWIVLGSVLAFPPVVTLANIPASGSGFRMVGPGGTESGRAVAGIGDIDSDGMDDVIVGAPATTVGMAGNAGRSYVVSGRATAPGNNVLMLHWLITPGILRFDGVGPGDLSGSALAGVGDINGDTIADFIIGTPRHDGGGAYVVFGSASLSSMSLANVVSSGHGFRLNLAGGYNTNAGAAVAGPGDVNGDGIDDFMVAIPGGLPSAEVNREVAVLFGHDASAAWSATVDLASFPQGMRLEHTSQVDVSGVGDLRGYVALAGGGDIDGDGINDMLVGSPVAVETTPGVTLGRGFAVFGRSGPPSDLIFSDGFEGEP